MLNSVSGIYLFSSLSFSVYYSVFKSFICNLTFEFILHLYSFFRCVLFFFIPVEGLCCRPKYWAIIIHRFDDQNSLTPKCIENWALFERLTHSQRSALSAWPGPPGMCQTQSPRKPVLFFVQFKDAYISTFQLPDLH